MRFLAIILIIGFVGFVIDLIFSGPQSKSERAENMRKGRIQK